MWPALQEPPGEAELPGSHSDSKDSSSVLLMCLDVTGTSTLSSHCPPKGRHRGHFYFMEKVIVQVKQPGGALEFEPRSAQLPASMVLLP